MVDILTIISGSFFVWFAMDDIVRNPLKSHSLKYSYLAVAQNARLGKISPRDRVIHICIYELDMKSNHEKSLLFLPIHVL